MPHIMMIVFVGLYRAFESAVSELAVYHFPNVKFEFVRVESSDDAQQILGWSERMVVVVDAENNRYQAISPLQLGNMLCQQDLQDDRSCSRIALADTVEQRKALVLIGYSEACLHEDLPSIFVRVIRELLPP